MSVDTLQRVVPAVDAVPRLLDALGTTLEALLICERLFEALEAFATAAELRALRAEIVELAREVRA